jgi:hypothetical protein
MATAIKSVETFPVGTVSLVRNEVSATDINGVVHALSNGDKVHFGDIIKTGNDSGVVISLDNGDRFDLGRNSQGVLDTDVVGHDPAMARAEALMEADAIAKALEQGVDPTQLMEATAAGGEPGAGDNEGSDSAQAPVVITRTGEVGDVTAGYDTIPQSRGFPEASYVIEDRDLLPEVSVTPLAQVGVSVETDEQPYDGYVPPEYQDHFDGRHAYVEANSAHVLEQTENPAVQGDEHQLVTFLFKLDAPYLEDVEITYQLREGTARQGMEADWHDGDIGLHTVTIPAGETEIAIPVYIHRDHLDEAGAESFYIDLLSAVNAEINPLASTASVTIYDDDTTPVAEDDANYVELGETIVTGNVLVNDTDEDGDALHGHLKVVVENGEPIVLVGPYGNLTIQENGEYVFELNELGMEKRDNLEPMDITFVNAYQVTDGYNTGNYADVQIDLDNGVGITGLTSGEVKVPDILVDEDGLVGAVSDTGQAGEVNAGGSSAVTGYFMLNAPDGIGNVTIDGNLVIEAGQLIMNQFVTGTLGSLFEITGFDRASGRVDYRYSLAEAEQHAGQGEDDMYEDLQVVLSDIDGDSTDADGVQGYETLRVQVVDDMPLIQSVENTAVSISVDSSDTGTIAALFGADGMAEENAVRLIATGQVMDSMGQSVTSDGQDLFWFADEAGGLYAASSQDAAHVLEMKVTEDGHSYTVTVKGQIDGVSSGDEPVESTISLPVSKEVVTTTTTYEQHEVNGEFDLSHLANRSYHADKGEYLGGYVDDGDGHALGFHFEGWVDPDHTVGNGETLVLEDVQKGQQGIGVNSNFIDNAYDYDKNGVDSAKNGDGDGEVLKLVFDKPVTSLDLYIDQLDEGEVGKYSIDEGETWRTFDGTSTGASSGSDEAFTVNDVDGGSFDSVWFAAMEGSDYSILGTHISATWIDTIEITETTTTIVNDTLSVGVIDDGGAVQVLDLQAVAEDGDGDISANAEFSTALTDDSSVQVSGSNVAGLDMAQGDRIDLSDIFDGQYSLDHLLNNGYLTVVEDTAARTATITVDPDGAGGFGPATFTLTDIHYSGDEFDSVTDALIL